MYKASAIVLYNAKTNQIHNLTINHKGTYITMIDYSKEKVQPYCYKSFMGLYQTILNFAKNNGFYYGKYNQFDSTWYDIAFIDINNPYKVEKYGFRKEEIKE